MRAFDSHHIHGRQSGQFRGPDGGASVLQLPCTGCRQPEHATKPVTIHGHAGVSLKSVSCAPVGCGYLALGRSSARFVSAWRQNRSKDVARARVDHDSAGCVQHGWARSSAALVTEVPQEGRTSVGRSRRARDVIPEFSDFSRILTELRLQHAFGWGTSSDTLPPCGARGHSAR